MLERVSLGQTRFATPGVATDARGVVHGKLGLYAFPSIDGVVAWLRLYSDEESLDDLLPTTRVLRARTPLGSRAFLLSIPAPTTYVLDRAARCARLAGGSAYTGTSKHFVRYRDEKSPYGYDVADFGPTQPQADVQLHGEDASVAYTVEGELAVATLIFRLSPRRVPGAERLDAEGRAQLYAAVAAGLAPGLLRYLLRNRVNAEAALVDFETRSAFVDPGQPDAFLFLRLHDLPERLLAGLRGVPGVTLFRPVAENVAVEVGWRHPISLTAVSSLFVRTKFHLFWGAADRLDVVKGPVEFSTAEHLSDLRLPEGAPRVREGSAAPLADDRRGVGVEIRLVPTLGAPRRVVGALVGWEEAARLKKLVYALPPALVAGHRIALAEPGILLLGGEGVDAVPLGTMLTEAAPGVLIPLGMDLIPRVPNDVLLGAIQHLGGAKDDRSLTVFPPTGTPFFVRSADLAPLERRILARIPVAAAAVETVAARGDADEVRVVNDPVGRFALWGLKPPAPKQP